VPWYRKGDYARLRALFADGARLYETYAEWSAAARATEAHLVAQGHRVVRVEIEPEEFAAWCSAGNVALDAEARMRYANEFAYLDKRFGDAQEASRAFNLAWSQWSVGPSASIVDTSNDCLATALCRPWSSA
jgi:hypothetical protein